MSDDIYRTALEEERKMHEDCNADLNRALDTIADLRAQLSESRQQIGNRYAEIARLLTQIAELQAWKDAVPVDALRWYFLNSLPSHTTYSVERSESDMQLIGGWLFPIDQHTRGRENVENE